MDEDDLCSESPPAPGIKGSFGFSCTQDKPFPLATWAALGAEHPPGTCQPSANPLNGQSPSSQTALPGFLQDTAPHPAVLPGLQQGYNIFFSPGSPKPCVFFHRQVSRLSSFSALPQGGFCCWLNFTLRQFLPEDLE